MATKLAKNASSERVITHAAALALALDAHVETVTDAEGFPVKVARVTLVEQEGRIVARPLRGYHLKTIDREVLAEKANAAHVLRKIGE